MTPELKQSIRTFLTEEVINTITDSLSDKWHDLKEDCFIDEADRIKAMERVEKAQEIIRMMASN